MKHICEICTKEAKWESESKTGRLTYRCNEHKVTKGTTGNTRKITA